ncbi:DUF4998 domain-containing protein [Niabella hirudinis]|uniref:DUF4998 domain-containing protein n=1 Tax=Niabella hirudinis TaxID=1285929 RepID=UPI003EBEA0D8
MKHCFFHLIAGVTLLMTACNKPTEYKKYLDDREIVYPGAPQNVVVQPQVNQLTFRFNPSTDPNITKYVVFWRNRLDSMAFTPGTHDPAAYEKLVVPGISEDFLSNYILYSVNKEGNYSVPVTLNNIRSIGDVYLNNLRNRPVIGVQAATMVATKIPMDSVYLAFKSNPDTFNLKTAIYWADKNNSQQESEISAQNGKVLLPGYKIGSWIYYQSFYKPNRYTDETYTPKTGLDSVRIIQNTNGTLTVGF